MIASLTARYVRSVAAPVLLKFCWNFGIRGALSVRRFEKRLKRGETFPAFMFLSVTNRCNLACKGCWVSPTPPTDMTLDLMERIVRDAKARQCSIFGLMGGEPLLHRGLIRFMGKHPDAYFLLFTNGMLINDFVAAELRRLGNVSPIISVEGLETESDARRGGNDVYAQTMEGLDQCVTHRLVTGVATSVCRTNIDEVVSEAFLDDLILRGVHYVWYYVYRPVGPRPSPELALDADDIVRLRQFMVDMRARKPLVIVDAYWDQDGRALCPAATGIAHHIGPAGDIEPCPPLQFADVKATAETELGACMASSRFLDEFRKTAPGLTRGCVIMEKPDAVLDLVQRTDARDSSGRESTEREFKEIQTCASHGLAGREIPEKHWAYRLAKRYWFFGFGAYG